MTTEIELAGAVSIYLALSANLARLSYQLVLTVKGKRIKNRLILILCTNIYVYVLNCY